MISKNKLQVKAKKYKKIFGTNIMSEVVSSEILEQAFADIYKKRKKYNHNSDIWHLSFHWKSYKARIQKELLSDTYNFEPLLVKQSKDGIYYALWSSIDAVVLKAMTIVLSRLFQNTEIYDDVYHLSGKGGLKGAVRTVSQKLSDYKYMIKSDVASFYASINHKILKKECKQYIKDRRLIRLIEAYANRLEDVKGKYKLVTLGISKGCPLSPLMGAIILKSLDRQMSKSYGYVRYMDDWVILAHSKSSLRHAVKVMHTIMDRLKLRLAPDKTFIGKISRGFEFLGYKFGSKGLIGIAEKTIDNFMDKVIELYEQRASQETVRGYIKRWSTWAHAGLRGS